MTGVLEGKIRRSAAVQRTVYNRAVDGFFDTPADQIVSAWRNA